MNIELEILKAEAALFNKILNQFHSLVLNKNREYLLWQYIFEIRKEYLKILENLEEMDT